MRLARLIFVLVAMVMATMSARALSDSADAPHVQVRLIVPVEGINRGESTHAGLYFKLEPGWHVYWINPGDAGEPPHIKWTLPSGITAGPLQFPTPKRLPLGPLMDFGYEDEAGFPFELNAGTTAQAGPALLHAKVDWLVCRATCIPGKAELELTRTVSDHPASFSSNAADVEVLNRFAARLPKPLPGDYKIGFKPSADGIQLTVETGQGETSAELFPADAEILDNPAPQKFAATARGFTLDLKKDANLSAIPKQLRGVLALSGGRAFGVVVPQGPPVAGGGATAAEEVAVSEVPVSSSVSTQNATAQSSSASSNGPGPKSGQGLFQASGLAFVGGLLLNLMPCVFPVLFLKGLALVQSGKEERHRLRVHGLVYAVGVLVSFWILVAALLSLRAAGARLGWGFQFQSPVFLSLMAGLLFFLGLSLAGQFEVGLSLTSAGGSLAAKQGYTGSFFTGVLAVIVATPCTAPFMGAAIGYALARPAAVTFAVFTALALGLAVPYVALTLQPAWTKLLPKPGAWMDVLKQAISVPIFATVIWLAWVLAQAYGAAMLAALLTMFLLLAIAGWFLGRWPARRWATSVAVLIVLSAVSMFVFASKSLIAAVPVSGAAETHGWEPWSAGAVVRYQSQGRPVFVDFTASWCLSCEVNERVALSKPDVQKAFADANVALLRADWTQHDDAITETLSSLGRSGVPAYALYVPGETSPRLLPEVLTPGIVTDALGKLPHAATQATAASSNR
jgi:thiol:disulfide interchange protein DsbD